MEISEMNIKSITEEAKSRGYDVTIRDISYAILRTVLHEELYAYTVVFGMPKKDDDITCYERLETVQFLLRFFSKEFAPKKEDKSDEIIKALNNGSEAKDVISFEENKSAMVELIQRTETALENGEIDTDKGLKIIADIRVKLNDKFKTAEADKSNILILPPPYDMICPHTNRECFQMTKEYAMNKWKLKE